MDIMALLLLFHTPLAWLGLGVLLMIAEVLSGEGSLLAFGLSALSVALLLWLRPRWCEWSLGPQAWGMVLRFVPTLGRQPSAQPLPTTGLQSQHP